MRGGEDPSDATDQIALRGSFDPSSIVDTTYAIVAPSFETLGSEAPVNR
jgi:hypothetical protein